MGSLERAEPETCIAGVDLRVIHARGAGGRRGSRTCSGGAAVWQGTGRGEGRRRSGGGALEEAGEKARRRRRDAGRGEEEVAAGGKERQLAGIRARLLTSALDDARQNCRTLPLFSHARVKLSCAC